jgi:hypothetical protein
MTPDPDQLRDFARRYTAAWCSQDPASVAEHYAPDGSLTINGGAPLIAESQGHYDQAEYDRQLEHGVEEPR